jgi:formylglycine-generating enzyme required for sulfatase activity
MRSVLFSWLMLPILLWPENLDSQSPSVTELLAIPTGAFLMGSDSGPTDERPVHRVELRSFSIDRTPVTNRQFAAFLNAVGAVGSTGQRLFDIDDGDTRIHKKGQLWTADPGFEEHPVVEVSWFGAQNYCAWVGKRLPTEAEWEKAARGTEARKFPWGNAPPEPTRARYGAGWRETVPVGSFPNGASLYGVLDLAGNGWEWVRSAYRPYPYNSGDGREAAAPDVERVTRGGGQDSPPQQLTTTYRGAGLSRSPGSGHHNIGFRCAG